MKPNIADVMTSTLETVQPTDSLAMAYKKMTGRHLPVIDAAANLVGIITDRDFKRAAISDTFNNKKLKFRDWATVADFMVRPVVTIDAQTPLIKVVETMISKKISAVLVTTENNLVGIITSEDLLFVLLEQLKQKRSFKEQIYEKINDWAYHSPIGQIVNILSDMGI